MKLLVMQSSQVSCYLVPLGPTCLTQDPILEKHQPVFLRHCEGRSFKTYSANSLQYSPDSEQSHSITLNAIIQGALLIREALENNRLTAVVHSY